MRLLAALTLALLLGCTAACEQPELPVAPDDAPPAPQDSATVTIGLRPSEWD